MVDQTTLDNGEADSVSPPRAVARDTAELMSDILTLGELQGRLLMLDVEAAVWKIIPLSITLLAGMVLAVACLPIALVTIALALVEYGELPAVQAFAIALLGGAIVSVALMGIAFWQFRRGLRLLERTQNEWKQNVRWIKNTLQRMGRTNKRASDAAAQSRW